MKYGNSIYIGDNLKVMTSPEFKKYENYFKMVYIDPPYNTQTKKSYNDKQKSTDWRKFISDRLNACIPLMREDGVIFISIDDNEYANLKLLCDDLFSRQNYIGTLITMQAQRSNAKLLNIVHEYILCYAKDLKAVGRFYVKRMDNPDDRELIASLYDEINHIVFFNGWEQANKEIKGIVKRICKERNITWLKNYANVDENGKIYFPMDLSNPSKPREVYIPEIGLHLAPLSTRGWASDEKFIELYRKKRLVYKNDRPYEKHYLEESEDNVPSILRFFSRMGTKDLKDLGLDGIFDTPKSVELLKYLIRISTEDNDSVLDFFAGSGTLAQAVYEINREDNANIDYTLVQADEKIRTNTEVYEKCRSLGIEPNMKDIILFRINTFLKKNQIKKDYVLT